MRLSPQAFNRFLNHIGQRGQWRQSFACPCVSPHSGAARPGCLQCGGRGRIWSDPVACVVGVPSANVQRQWAQFGSWEQGDMVVSVGSDSAAYAMGQFDRFLALDNKEVFSMPLTRGQNDRFYFQVDRVTRVFWLDDAEAIVEGGIPTVSSTGALTWVSGEPPAGKQYTITGEKRHEFFCFGQFPGDRAEHQGAALPRKVVLRKFDLYSRSGST